MRRVPLLVWSASFALSACSGPDGDLPAAYRRLAVPYARLDTAAARGRGRALYLQNCALCHGVRADGRGVRREGLSSSPRDFTDATWQKRNSARRIFFTIREGVRGTSMSAWGSLSDADAWDLVAYIRSLEKEIPSSFPARERPTTGAFTSGSPPGVKTILGSVHEMGIAAEIYRIARGTANDRGGGPLESVTVVIGDLAAVEPDLLEFAWRAAVEGTADAKARLLIDWRPAKQACSRCGEIPERMPGSWLRLCPHCEEPLAVSGGDELDVRTVAFSDGRADAAGAND